MVKKSKVILGVPGLPAVPEERNYISVSISNADNGYVMDAHSNKSNVKLVFTDKDEMLEAVSKFLDAEPEEE